MAIYFRGSANNDRIDLGNIDIPSGTGSMSITCWINAVSWGENNEGRIISKATSTAEEDHWWMLSSRVVSGNPILRARLKTGTGSTKTLESSTGFMTLNTDLFCSFVYNGSNMLLYGNATQIGSTSKTGNVNIDNTVPASIGAQPQSSREWDGRIDDIRIYSRALNIKELQTMYATRGIDNIITGLYWLWRLDEKPINTTVSGSGSVKDYSGNGANGTPNDAPYYSVPIVQWRRLVH